MFNINNKIFFDEMESKNGKKFFYKKRKLFGLVPSRKEVFSIVISYRGGDIEINNMYQDYITEKRAGKYKYLQLSYEDIVALGEFLAHELKLPIANTKDETIIDWNIAQLNAFIKSGKLSYQDDIRNDLMNIIKPYNQLDGITNK